MRNEKKYLYLLLNFVFLLLVGVISYIIFKIINEDLGSQVIFGITVLGILCYIAMYFGLDFRISVSYYLIGVITSFLIFFTTFYLGGKYLDENKGALLYFLSPLSFYFTFKKVNKIYFKKVNKIFTNVKKEAEIKREEYMVSIEEQNQFTINRLDSQFLTPMKQLEDYSKKFSTTLSNPLLYQEEYAHGTGHVNQVMGGDRIYNINNGKPTPYSLKFMYNENDTIQYTFMNDISKNNDDAFQYLEEVRVDLESAYEELISMVDRISNQYRSAYVDAIIKANNRNFNHVRSNPLTQINNSKVIDILNHSIEGMKRQKDNFEWNYNLLKNYYDDFQKKYYSVKSGLDGEDKVNAELKKWSGFIENLSNIYLQYGEWKFECDNIILSSYGIFVLEVKNIGANGKMVLRQEENGRWHKIQVNDHGKTKDEIMDKSPCAQNDEHVAYLNQFLREKLNKNITDIYGIVVIANNNVELDIRGRGQAVVREYKIMDEIRYQNTQNVLTQEELEQIKKVIVEHNMPPKKYKVRPYTDVLLSNKKELMKQGNMLLEQLRLIQSIEEVYVRDLKL